MGRPKLIDKLNRKLPPQARHALAILEKIAQGRALTLYLVGGPVRDLLLGQPTIDLDLTVEGDAPALAQEAAQALNARCVVHPQFLTATVKRQGFALDLTTARSETYHRPGALPRVRPSSIREDMLRRDFTINAMALPLTGPQRGDLFDPCGGQQDLAAGLIRALHHRSFQDDATRILRAARYEQRFRFRLEEQTLAWLKRDVGYLQTITGPRIRQEMMRIMQELYPERPLLRLQELGALHAVHPSLSLDTARARAFARLRRLAPDTLPAAYWCTIAWDLSPTQAASLAQRLALPRHLTQALTAPAAIRPLEATLVRKGLRPSQVLDLLSPHPLPAIAALAALTQNRSTRQRCLSFLRHWRYVKPILNGASLLAMGVPRGPAVREALTRLRAARLDGEVRTRREEEQLVHSLLASLREVHAL